MRWLSIVLIIVGISIPAKASASDWWFVELGGNKPNRSVIFMDRLSIQSQSANVKRIWSETYYETALQGVQTDKTLWEFSCASQTYKVISWIDYKANGDVARSQTPSYYSQPTEPVAPDTVGESELKFVCGQQSNAIEFGEIPDLISTGKGALAVLDKP